jgi:polar amino acid transport system substrate-binding protein
MHFLLCVLLVFLFTGTGLATGHSNTDKTVEIEYGYPDQSIFEASLNYKGYPTTPVTRLVEILMAHAGLSWHATPYPAKRLFHNLRSGITNFSILVKATSLQDSCIFSRDPIYTTHLNFYYLSGSPPIASKEEMVGKKIITIRGYSYADLRTFIEDPSNRITNVVAGTHRAAFEMLKAGRANYLLDYASAAGDILSSSPNLDIRSTPIGLLDIFLVLSKSYPDVQQLMRKLEEIVDTLDVEAILLKK